MLAFRIGDIKFSLAGSEPGWRQTQQRDTSCWSLGQRSRSLLFGNSWSCSQCQMPQIDFLFLIQCKCCWHSESFWMPGSQRLSSYSSCVHSIDGLSVYKNLNVLQEQCSSGHLDIPQMVHQYAVLKCMHLSFHPAVHQILSRVNWVASPLLVSWYLSYDTGDPVE